ncbi:27078_t:CDS:2, partial [Gigaspora margarita]
MTSTEKTERPSELFIDLHVKYIQSLDTVTKAALIHLPLDLMNNVDALNKGEVVKYVVSCGFGGHIGHDPHLLYTHYAVLILQIEDSLDAVNVEKIVEYVASRQDRQTGAFTGDEWGEIDSRFSYSAISCLSLLKRLDAIDVKKATEFIMLCKNFDGLDGRPEKLEDV